MYPCLSGLDHEIIVKATLRPQYVTNSKENAGNKWIELARQCVYTQIQLGSS